MAEFKAELAIVSSRCKIAAGDIGAVLLNGIGWLHVRVVTHRSAFSSFLPVDRDSCSLIYVFNGVAADPLLRKRFLVSDLLGPPLLIDAWWEEGFWLPVGSRPFEAGELLDVHCIVDTEPRLPVYFDEQGRILPHRIEPCAQAGIHGETWVARMAQEAHAAGRLRFDFEPGTPILPPPPFKPKKPRKLKRGSVTLRFQGDQLPDDFDLESMESLIEPHLSAARAGKWTGHGQDLETGELDIEFEGKDPNAIFECIRAALKGSPLAKLGWCLLSPEYENQPMIRRELAE
jgi:hypothetical protein